jgi:hypothetical protein
MLVDLLIRENGLVNGIVVNKRLSLVGETAAVEHEKKALGVFIEVGIAGSNFLHTTISG